MAGRATWQLRHRLLVMFLLRLQWPMDAIINTFMQIFPEVSCSRTGHPTKKPIGHNKESIEYCRRTYLRAEVYNLDSFWGDPSHGKLGYLLGLRILGHSISDIARRIQTRFSALRWPAGHTKEEAVEIAVVTYHEYALYSGNVSLIAKYPDANAFVPNWVMNCFLVNGIAPEFIRGPTVDMTGMAVAPITFDEVVFILTRFVPDFADYWSNAFTPNPPTMIPNQNLMMQ